MLTEDDVDRGFVEDVSAKLAEPRGRLGIQPGSAYVAELDDWARRPKHDPEPVVELPPIVLESPAYLNGRMLAFSLAGCLVGAPLGAVALFVALRACGAF